MARSRAPGLVPLVATLLLLCFAFTVPILAISSSPETTSSTTVDDSPIIGIDLGTTYSCVSVFRNGQVEVIPNAQGNRITPSYVAFPHDSEIVVGDEAKKHTAQNPTSTIFDIKRLIGRDFAHASVKADSKLLPYRIVNQQGRPHVAIDEKQVYSPEEISAMILRNLKDAASNYLGREVTRAVVTVPGKWQERVRYRLTRIHCLLTHTLAAYFNQQQRQATKKAGMMAGLQVERMINEPTAAALAYGLRNGTILVYDLGGGTLDVTLLDLDEAYFVLATNGNTHLGGQDFDNRVMEYILNSSGVKNCNDPLSWLSFDPRWNKPNGSCQAISRQA